LAVAQKANEDVCDDAALLEDEDDLAGGMARDVHNPRATGDVDGGAVARLAHFFRLSAA
jgi:hypothetical protein